MSSFLAISLGEAPDFGAKASAVHEAMQKAFLGWGNEYLTLLVKTRLSGSPGLNRRTGNLSRDWVVENSSTASEASVTIKSQGAANAYAGIQEHGGVITPKAAKALWIPLPGNLDGRGVARLTPRQAISAGGFIRNGVFYGKPPTKGQAKGMGPHVTPLFVLRTRVTIRGNMGANNLFRSRIPVLQSELADSIQKAVS